MKKLLIGLAAGIAIGIGSAAQGGTSGKNYYLHRGDAAITYAAETVCTDLYRDGSGGFVCSVGGDYRAKYGVIINSTEAVITQYTGFNRYHVLVRKSQSPLKSAR